MLWLVRVKRRRMKKVILNTLVVFCFCAAAGSVAQADTVEKLIEKLKNKNPAVRTNAALLLGEIKEPRAVEPLLIALKDEDPDVRKEASLALRMIGSLAVEPLIAALKNKNVSVQDEAVSVLVKIGKPAVKPLRAALKSEDSDIRKKVIWTLSKIAERDKPSGSSKKCPVCGSKKNVVPIIYGLSGPKLKKKVKQGKCVLGGRVIRDAHWYCTTCEYRW